MPKDTNIREEQFWFTATTVGVNAFLFGRTAPIPSWLVVSGSVVMSIYCVFLIIHRSAAHAHKLVTPKMCEHVEEKDKTWRHKAAETRMHIRVVFRHIPFVICELSGAFFYVMLAVASCVAVLIRCLLDRHVCNNLR
jgi:hypothetical protein